jgi:hypothetical protein
MKATALIASIAALKSVSAEEMGKYELEFMRFIATHNRRYATKEEYALRLVEFSRNFE